MTTCDTGDSKLEKIGRNQGDKTEYNRVLSKNEFLIAGALLDDDISAPRRWT